MLTSDQLGAGVMRRFLQAIPGLLAIAVLTAVPAASAWAQSQSQSQAQAQWQEQQRAQAQQRRDDNENRNRTPPPPRDSASDAVRRAERDTRGEVLSVERVQYDGRDMHRVKVVDDRGHVRVYMQDSSKRSGNRTTSSNDDD